MGDYDKGQLVRVAGRFQNASAAYVDPATVRFKYKNPSGTITTLTYLTDAALVKDATGEYHVDVDASVSGTWHYRWESTGTNQAADEGKFEVAESAF